MTFIRTWRIRSFRARLLEFLNGNTSVAFCKVPENAAETPTLSSKLCTNPKNAYLCEVVDYTNTARICSMKPNQCIELTDWVSCSGGLPLGSGDVSEATALDLDVLFECEMEPHAESSSDNIMALGALGAPLAWKAGAHLAVVLRTDMERLSRAGYGFVAGDFIVDHKLPVVRIQTVQVSGSPNPAADAASRGLRSELHRSLKRPPADFQWPLHAALLRRLSRVVDVEDKVTVNGGGSEPRRPAVLLADVSVNTSKSLTDDQSPEELVTTFEVVDDTGAQVSSEVVVDNVTVEIQHNITPKKSSLKLDLKQGTSRMSSSLLNISSQIKSVTTHKRIVSTTGPKKPTALPLEGASRDAKSASTTKIARPLINTKSPNVIIYSDSAVASENLEATLRKVLDCDRYSFIRTTAAALEGGGWRRPALVAVAGPARAAPLLLAHLLDGGRLLALCSDLLHTVLPYYKTAEIRENEIVQFKYDKWKSVKMKHSIFCYQASPAKKQFSTESDRQPSKYTGHPGHTLDIQVLASEQTWNTPSLLQATDSVNRGVAIFSQIHLEADPRDYLDSGGDAADAARLEILHKILGELLGLHVRDPAAAAAAAVRHTRGYFLGNHVDKLALVESWGKDEAGRTMQRFGDLTLQWCGRGEPPAAEPGPAFLPVCVHECPENFCTVTYFDNLTSHTVGRLVLYADVLGSSQALAGGGRLAHGAAVVARRQTAGRGRAGNTWVSPAGQASVTVQLWLRSSPRVSLVQHAAALAAVLAVRARDGYEELDVRIKWPNDIYYGREAKLGGNVTTVNCYGEDFVVNTGTGLNVSNSAPTTCVNDVISAHNATRGACLPHLTVEEVLARYCSHLEVLLELIETDLDAFLGMYYRYWLHDNEQVRVHLASASSPVAGTVVGVDAAGWLRVRVGGVAGVGGVGGVGEELTVAPDGNRFDMMSGLIATKP